MTIAQAKEKNRSRPSGRAERYKQVSRALAEKASKQKKSHK